MRGQTKYRVNFQVTRGSVGPTREGAEGGRHRSRPYALRRGFRPGAGSAKTRVAGSPRRRAYLPDAGLFPSLWSPCSGLSALVFPAQGSGLTKGRTPKPDSPCSARGLSYAPALPSRDPRRCTASGCASGPQAGDAARRGAKRPTPSPPAPRAAPPLRGPTPPSGTGEVAPGWKGGRSEPLPASGAGPLRGAPSPTKVDGPRPTPALRAPQFLAGRTLGRSRVGVAPEAEVEGRNAGKEMRLLFAVGSALTVVTRRRIGLRQKKGR